MELSIEHDHRDAALTIVGLRGSLDARSFERLIDEARRLYAAGTRKLLLDMTELKFMGSSGLVALRSVMLTLQGRTPPDPEHGWAAFHELDQDRGGGGQALVKLLNPHEGVQHTLHVTGMLDFFEIYSDRQAALLSFRADRQ